MASESPVKKDGVICGDCGRLVPFNQYLTEVNPPGGFGQDQVLLCDDCIKSPQWDYWRLGLDDPW